MEGRKDAVCFFLMLANGKRRRMHVAEQKKCFVSVRYVCPPDARREKETINRFIARVLFNLPPLD